MSALREAAQQALEALEHIGHHYISLPKAGNKAITALRAALAQQEQEQDAEAWVDKGSIAWLGEQRSLQRRKVRSRREWQGLSEEEIDRWTPEIHPVTRAVEAALKEKNA
jgi:hypothetical protein